MKIHPSATQRQVAEPVVAQGFLPLLDGYAHVLSGEDDGRQTWRQLRVINQLGITRGTLND